MSKSVVNRLTKRYSKWSIETKKQNDKFIQVYKGQKGFFIKSRPGGNYNYKIHFRYMDLSFNWLNWDNPYTDIWFFINWYTDRFMKWVDKTFDVDLRNGSTKEIVNFLFDTGMIEVEGNPSDYALYKLHVLIRNMLHFFNSAEGDIGG